MRFHLPRLWYHLRCRARRSRSFFQYRVLGRPSFGLYLARASASLRFRYTDRSRIRRESLLSLRPSSIVERTSPTPRSRPAVGSRESASKAASTDEVNVGTGLSFKSLTKPPRK